MGMRSEALQTEDHRRLGIDLYNRTWTLMDAPGDEMLHCAHASAYHWMQGGGTTANCARSEWLCSRVYSILGLPEPALHHARRCLELVESSPEEMEDWDLAAAHEALARADLAAGEPDEARRNYSSRARTPRRSRTRRTPSTSRRTSTRCPFRDRQRPRGMVETSRTSGCGGRRHSNGRIRARCQLDRRPRRPTRRRWVAPGRTCWRARSEPYVRGAYWTLANGQSDSSHPLTARHSGASRSAWLSLTQESARASSRCCAPGRCKRTRSRRGSPGRAR